MSEKLDSVNKLVFVHGLRSTNKACWCDLPRLLRDNEVINGKFEIIDDFNYSTGLFVGNTDISEICDQLIRHLGGLLRVSQASSLTFVAHSQGGLVSRRYVIELIRYAKQRNIGLPLIRILTFATPHLGAYSSTAGKVLSSIISRQTSELSFDSISLSEINQAWSDECAERRVEMLRVVAEKDGIVPDFSARGGRYDVDVISMADHDHTSCTKVHDVNHPAYKITCEFALRPLSRRVGDLAGLIGAPLLRLNILREPRGASQKVQFNAMQAKLVDREQEMQALLNYCLAVETDSALSKRRAGGALWAHIRGGAGVGKSRLALELCLLLQRHDWHAGFLANNQLASFNWASWEPVLPTLIVVDYATARPEELKAIFEGVFNRNEENFIKLEVRFLLIDRLHSENELDAIIGASSKSAQVDNCKYVFSEEGRGDLEIGLIASGYNVFVDYWTQDNRSAPPGLEVFFRVMRNNELEPGNPLHVGLAYQIIGKNFYTDNARNDKSVVLDKMIAREVTEYWKPIATEARVSLDDIKDWVFLASISGGISRRDISTGAVEVKVWPRNFGESFKKISSYSQDKGLVHPLQPHLVAERFCEKYVCGLDGEQQTAFVEWALTNAPKRFANFYFRLKQDFPVVSEFDRVLLDLDFCNLTQDAAGSLGFCLGLITAPDQASVNKSKCYLRLLDICEKWSASSDIHMMAAMATTNMVSSFGERDPIIAFEYLNKFKEVSSSFESKKWHVKDLSISLFNMADRFSVIYGPNDDRVVTIIKELECLVGKFSEFDEPITRLAMLYVNLMQFAMFDADGQRSTLKRLKGLVNSGEVPDEVYYQFCLCISNIILSYFVLKVGGDFWDEFVELEGVVRMGKASMIPSELIVNLRTAVAEMQESDPVRAARVSQTLTTIENMFPMLH